MIKDDKTVIGLIALADMIHEQSSQAIATLQADGIKTAMVTGDSEDVAAYVARQLGLDQYYAEVKPEDKGAKLKSYKTGSKVASVGDGINDAPALTTADVGIAIGAGTDIAIKSADIILVSDPGDVIKVVRLSKATYRKMLQNLV